MYFGLWILVFLGALVVELATATSLVSIWFCVGALFALGALALNLAFIWQVVIFFAASLVCLAAIRPMGFPVFTRQYCRDERRPGDRPTCPASERHYRGSLGRTQGERCGLERDQRRRASDQ